MLPEVEEYYNAVEKAEERHQKMEIEIDKKYKHYTNEWYDAWDKEKKNHAIRLKRARNKLHRNASSALIAWISNPKGDVASNDYYWSHAEKLLKLFPATDAQIKEFVDDAQWCGVWDRLRTKALKEGVLNPFFQLEYRFGIMSWTAFRRRIMMTDGQILTENEILAWFHRGAKELSFQVRETKYEFRLTNTFPIK